MVEYDAIIVGAGILGLSAAYHIKAMRPNAEILVVDKLSSSGQANTARSAAAFRCVFSSPTNYRLADPSVEFYRHLQEDLDVDLKMQWLGYLWLLTEENYREMLPILKNLRREMDLKYEEYEEEYLTQKLRVKTDLTKDEEAQLMGLGNVFGGILVPKAGVINDVDSLVKFYEKEFLRLDGKIHYGVKVENLVVKPSEPLDIPSEPYFWQNARVAGVRTDKGLLKSKKVVLAAGVWIPEILDDVGIECFIKPQKRQFFTIAARSTALRQLLFAEGFNRFGCMPFTILPNPRVYIRPFPKEEVYWVGYADMFPRAFKLEENPQPEKNFYEYGIHQVLAKYFPQFKDCRPASAMAGLYQVNTLDGHPVIFEENDLIVVGGASGSGISKADAIGRIAAALYVGEEYASLYGDKKFKVSDLSLKNRRTEPEKLIL